MYIVALSLLFYSKISHFFDLKLGVQKRTQHYNASIKHWYTAQFKQNETQGTNHCVLMVDTLAGLIFLTVLYVLQKDEKTPVPSSSMPFFMGTRTRFSS